MKKNRKIQIISLKVRFLTNCIGNTSILRNIQSCLFQTGFLLPMQSAKIQLKLEKKIKLQFCIILDLCRQICSETDGCLYWTWQLRAKNGRNKVCKLKSGILETGFRRQRNNAVSGTMLNGCNPIDNSGGNNNSGNDLDNR